MSDSLFSKMIPIIDSAIVDVAVTADSHRQSKLQNLIQARAEMLDVAGIMESIYHQSYACGADLCDLSKTACDSKAECEELVLKRQRIEGKIVMAGDDPAEIRCAPIAFVVLANRLKSDSGQRTHPIIARNCQGKCDECELGEV